MWQAWNVASMAWGPQNAHFQKQCVLNKNEQNKKCLRQAWNAVNSCCGYQGHMENEINIDRYWIINNY